jgi:nucleotide-binding universal stress UspA family protein
MDRILVADEGSAAASRAIEVVIDLAKNTGAELSAIAVVDPSDYRQTEITAFAQPEELKAREALDPIIDEAAAYVDRCRTIAAPGCVSRIQIEKRSGSNPASEILDLARERSVDLIVLGSRGRHRLPGLILERSRKRWQAPPRASS